MFYFEEEFEFLRLVFVVKVMRRWKNFVIGKDEFFIFFVYWVGKFICVFVVVFFMVLLVIVMFVGVIVYCMVVVVVLFVNLDEDIK